MLSFLAFVIKQRCFLGQEKSLILEYILDMCRVHVVPIFVVVVLSLLCIIVGICADHPIIVFILPVNNIRFILFYLYIISNTQYLGRRKNFCREKAIQSRENKITENLNKQEIVISHIDTNLIR